jgi:hypothetical protein
MVAGGSEECGDSFREKQSKRKIKAVRFIETSINTSLYGITSQKTWIFNFREIDVNLWITLR